MALDEASNIAKCAVAVADAALEALASSDPPAIQPRPLPAPTPIPSAGHDRQAEENMNAIAESTERPTTTAKSDPPVLADLVGIDVTDESLNSRVFNALASSPKVPYTDVGISLIEVWAGSWTGIVTAGLEHGPGIAALNLQAPPRPRRRHQTTSWDPDMPLPDAEPGRYGWLP